MRRVLALLVLISVSLTLAGCFAQRERVMLPPRVELEGVRTLAVVPFDNHSADPGLGVEIGSGIAAAMKSEYYTVAAEQDVAEGMRELRISRGESLGTTQIRQLGERLDVDALILGEVLYYFEDVNQDVPSSQVSADGTSARWTVTQRTDIQITASARVVTTADGRTQYSRRFQGTAGTTDRDRLSWTQVDAPPHSLVPRPSRSSIPIVRMQAIEDAVSAFCTDLLPRYTYQRVDE